MPTHTRHTIVFTVCGWKALHASEAPVLDGTGEGSHELRLELFDFAPGALRDQPIDPELEIPPPPPGSSEPEMEIVRTSSTLGPLEGTAFTDTITTTLPYRHVKKTMEMEGTMRDFILTADGYIILDDQSKLRVYSI